MGKVIFFGGKCLFSNENGGIMVVSPANIFEHVDVQNQQ